MSSGSQQAAAGAVVAIDAVATTGSAAPARAMTPAHERSPS